MKILKPFRVVLSLLFFTLTFLVFVDFNGSLNGSTVQDILFLQILQSVLQFIQAASIFASGFLVVAVVTILFGRIYCSSVCPLGTLMDIVIRIKKRICKYRGIPVQKSPVVQYYQYHRTMTWPVPGFRKVKITNVIRYLVLAAVVLSFLMNSLLLISLLDPFSLAGKMFFSLFRPMFFIVINLVNEIARIYGISFGDQITVTFLFSSVFLFSLFTLLTIIFLAWHKGRWYCNVLCPAGILLGLISRMSVFRLKISLSECSRCGKCLQVCKAGCIHPDHYRIDADRCVLCYNCIHACNDRAIGFSFPRKEKVKKDTFDFSRRRFIETMVYGIPAFGCLMGFNTLGKHGGASSANSETEVPLVVLPPATPPGSISLEHFTGSCTACHLCMSVCPTGVLQPSLLDYGLSGIFQPKMDFHSGFCHDDCTRCSEVCPTGAIQPLPKEQKKRVRIGKAIFIKNLCIVTAERRNCGLCAAKCRTKAIALVPYLDNLYLPVVDETKCTGCGACEFVCPVRPDRAITVEPLTVHELVVRN